MVPHSASAAGVVSVHLGPGLASAVEGIDSAPASIAKGNPSNRPVIRRIVFLPLSSFVRAGFFGRPFGDRRSRPHRTGRKL
jgi:hypothetical protein